MSDFQGLKLEILEFLHLSKDAVHIHLGLLVFVLALLVLQGRRPPWLAWTAAALAAFMLELLDLRDDWRSLGVLRWGASLHDIANTVFWPTLLTLLIRFRIGLPKTSDSPVGR